jgi:hypothetical protein
MTTVRHKARFDWLVEAGGASAFALAAGFSAFKAGPSFGMAPAGAMLGGGFGSLALALIAMRSTGPDPRVHRLPEFTVDPIEGEDVLELTQVVAEPLLLDTVYEGAPVEDLALMLEDALPEADPASRVIQLFAAQPMPTPGQLKERIDRHLAVGSMHVVREFEGPAPDASDALFAALNELKRSLR